MTEFIVARIDCKTPVFVQNISMVDGEVDYTNDPMEARIFRDGWEEVWESEWFARLPAVDLADPQASVTLATEKCREYWAKHGKEVEIMEELPLESWRHVWRKGVEPLLSDAALEALRDGIKSDDEHLLQGATTTPPPLQCVQDWPVEAACALGYCGWKGDGLETVGETEEFFARLCFDIDQRLGEPAGVRHWLNHWDDTERYVMFRDMLPEIEAAIARRQGLEVPA